MQCQSRLRARSGKTWVGPVSITGSAIGLCLLFMVGFLVIFPATLGLPFSGAMAQTSATQIDRAEISQTLKTAEREIAKAAGSLGEADDETALLSLRDDLRAVRDSVDALLDPLETRLSELDASLAALGEAPTNGQTETREIVAERKRLDEAIAETKALMQQTQLALTEINLLLESIIERRREEFTTAIFARTASPLLPSLWQQALPQIGSGVSIAFQALKEWTGERRENATLWPAIVVIGFAALVGILVFGPFRRWANRAFLHQLQADEPTHGRRAIVAIIRVLTRAVPGLFAGLLIYQAMRGYGLVTPVTSAIFREIWFGFVAILITDAGASAIFAPSIPGWRLVPLETRSAVTLRAGLSSLVALLFLDRVLARIAETFDTWPELRLLQSAGIGVLMALIFLALSRKSIWALTDEGKGRYSSDSQSLWSSFRYALRTIGLISIAAILFGYVSLGHYATTRTVMVGGLIALGLAIHLIVQELISLFDRRLAVRAVERSATEADQPNIIFFWLMLFGDALIFLCLTPFAILALGADWSDVKTLMSDAFTGFRVGNFEISIAKILSALIVFFLVLLLTRFIQRLAVSRFFPRRGADTGLRHSMKTLIGYIGLVIAFMTGVSMLGFNLSNLAIIAGALSVGIGFGLQSIVNNFVSGLILLFERPIKVGDWIVVASGEGIVKQISVRSTEIETFDRSSIIVPNSELISGTVTNWTHKSKIGRFIVDVGVAYDSDPEMVEKLLKEVAHENPDILSYPAPFVYFKGFGDSSMNFDLRAFVRDIGSSLGIRSAVRKTIWKKFRENGIEIPFPQRDLNIRHIPADLIDTLPVTGPQSEIPEKQE